MSLPFLSFDMVCKTYQQQMSRTNLFEYWNWAVWASQPAQRTSSVYFARILVFEQNVEGKMLGEHSLIQQILVRLFLSYLALVLLRWTRSYWLDDSHRSSDSHYRHLVRHWLYICHSYEYNHTVQIMPSSCLHRIESQRFSKFEGVELSKRNTIPMPVWTILNKMCFFRISSYLKKYFDLRSTKM